MHICFAKFLLIKNMFNSGEVAKLFADAGLICVASLISPYRRDRDICRAMLPDANFIEARLLLAFLCHLYNLVCMIFDSGIVNTGLHEHASRIV